MNMAGILHMGGYAAYVWSSYGIALLVLALNLVVPVIGRRRLLRSLALRSKRKRASR